MFFNWQTRKSAKKSAEGRSAVRGNTLSHWISDEPVKLMRVDCVPTLQCRLDWQERFWEIDCEGVFEHHDECDCERCNVNFDRE